MAAGGEEVVRRVRACPADVEPVVLLTTGSFNPVHRQHVEMHRIAKAHLEALHGMRVLASFFSPSHDNYLRSKLAAQGRSACFLPFAARCDLLQDAIAGHNGYFLDTVRGPPRDLQPG
jgi:nicotinic acid mononucleotide adenylyltransferase